MLIANLPPDDRPRERLYQHGVTALSYAELLALVLRQGTSQTNAVELGALLLERFGSPAALRAASLDDLCRIPGLGPAKAATLIAAFQLGRSEDDDAHR